VPVDSQGARVYVDNGVDSPVVWVEIAGATNIRGLRSGAGAEIDTTTLASTAKEFRLGLKDEGSMSMDLITEPADPGYQRLVALRNSRLVGEYQVVVPTGSPSWTLSFTGIVTVLGVDFAVDDVVRTPCQIRVTGEIIETGG
jgi:hypothetical protein